MKLSRRRWMTIAGVALLANKVDAIGYPGASTGAISVRSGRAFGSDWHLTTSVDTDGQLAHECVEQAVREVNQSLSPYLVSSELSMFNRLSSKAWCDVSTHFGRVLGISMKLADLSANAFDPTLGPVVNRFGFGPIKSGSVTGINHLEARSDRVRKLHSGITLDLCGAAKGYAIDLAASYMRQQGIRHFLLEVGGELIAQGNHPSGRQWTVAIEEPVAGSNALYTLLPLRNQAIATSGET